MTQRDPRIDPQTTDIIRDRDGDLIVVIGRDALPGWDRVTYWTGKAIDYCDLSEWQSEAPRSTVFAVAGVKVAGVDYDATAFDSAVP